MNRPRLSHLPVDLNSHLRGNQIPNISALADGKHLLILHPVVAAVIIRKSRESPDMYQTAAAAPAPVCLPLGNDYRICEPHQHLSACRIPSSLSLYFHLFFQMTR